MARARRHQPHCKDHVPGVDGGDFWHFGGVTGAALGIGGAGPDPLSVRVVYRLQTIAAKVTNFR